MVRRYISVVSMRSLTSPFSPTEPGTASRCLAGWLGGLALTEAVRHVVPPRPPTHGQPRAARRLHRGRGAALVRRGPLALGPVGADAAGLPRRLADGA